MSCTSMYRTHTSGLLILLCLAVSSWGFFGLTAKRSLDIEALIRIAKNVESNNNVSNRKLCDFLNLHHKQKRVCQRSRGIAVSLIEAVKVAVDECRYQFRNERWNCTLPRYNQRILRKGFKESSFMYALSSAGLVHTISNACSQGVLERCTCDESKVLENTKTWMWGGCGHNIRYGIKFTRKFLNPKRKFSIDMRARVDKHNSNVGIQTVRENVRTVCKCHGVSGSCTMKSCWRQLAPFKVVSLSLKGKYERSLKLVSYTNYATRRLQLANVNNGQLVFTENSPSYCVAGRYSPGTSGRKCQKDTSCDVICCGRGYNVKHQTVRKSCQCQVIWCCSVNCKICQQEQQVYTCK